MSLPYLMMEAQDLVMLFDEKKAAAVIDVRDSERSSDGWIKGSLHMPSGQLTDEKLLGILDWVQASKPAVGAIVFHCAFSQVRGPSAATRFAKLIARQTALSPSSLSVPPVFVLRGGYNSFAQQFYGARRDLFELS
jgi:rhodanese-related sulfurtransferase